MEQIIFRPAIFILIINSLDRPVYPKKGIKSELEGDWVYTQNPDMQLHTNARDADTVTASNPYPRIRFHFESYTPLSGKKHIAVFSCSRE